MNSIVETTPFVVAELPGSLPMGGVVPDTPIYAFKHLPDGLMFQSNPYFKQHRTDIDLGGSLAFLIDNVITVKEANELIHWSEVLGFRDEAPGIRTAPGMRMNKTVHWVADENLLGPIMERIYRLLPHQIDSNKLHNRLSHRINVYKYDNNDVFNKHIDGDWPGFGLSKDGTEMLEWEGQRSKLTMLLYLNEHRDGVCGGNTVLYGAGGETAEVSPKKGAALFFRHGFGPHSVPHMGAVVTSDTPKYVARINVLYKSD